MEIRASASVAPVSPASRTDPAGRTGVRRDDAGERPKRIAATRELTDDQKRQIVQLQLRDREVRAHEAAHKAGGGGHTGAATYTYQTGPDGKRYAIGGEVPVDLSPANTPQATIAKMAQIKAAALAPADPSSADRAVAAAAASQAAAAQVELREQTEEARKVETDQADTEKPEETEDVDPAPTSIDPGAEAASGPKAQAASDTAKPEAKDTATDTDEKTEPKRKYRGASARLPAEAFRPLTAVERIRRAEVEAAYAAEAERPLRINLTA